MQKRYLKKILIGSRYVTALQPALIQNDVEVLPVPDNPDVAEAVCGHADLSVFYDGEKDIFLAPYLRGSELSASLKALGLAVHIGDFRQGRQYPQDVQLNICRAGNACFCNPATADADIFLFLRQEKKYRMISVRQGYSACSALYLTDNAMITSDRGIFSAAIKSGFDVLYITPGHIRLPGYEYGFIGGSAFLLKDRTLAFTGSLHEHPDHDRILSFLQMKNITPVFLTDEPIFDIGGAIIIP